VLSAQQEPHADARPSSVRPPIVRGDWRRWRARHCHPTPRV